MGHFVKLGMNLLLLNTRQNSLITLDIVAILMKPVLYVHL